MRRPALLLGAALVATSLAGPAPASAATCSPVRVVAVRGTFEKGTVGGALTPLTQQLRRAVPGATVTGLRYPATSDWVRSADAGVGALSALLTTASQACPQQRFVLIGYSQGAWVIGDALSPDGVGTARVTPAAGARIAAIVMYGDPRFVAGEPSDAGTHRDGVSGLIPRPAGALDGYAGRIRSFCDGDDVICQSGSSGQGHVGYWPKDDRSAIAFVRSQLSEPAAAPVTPPPTAAPTAAPAPTATPAPDPAPEPPRRTWFQRFVRWVNPFD